MANIQIGLLLLDKSTRKVSLKKLFKKKKKEVISYSGQMRKKPTLTKNAGNGGEKKSC